MSDQHANLQKAARAPLSGRVFRSDNPGLKPWAILFNRFAVIPTVLRCTRLCASHTLSFCNLSFVILNELQASSAFDCSGSESCDEAALYDGEKQNGGHDGDDRAGGDQSPFHLQALEKALQAEW